jgi:drug/metabolite transporter (DMT)-like permease
MGEGGMGEGGNRLTDGGSAAYDSGAMMDSPTSVTTSPVPRLRLGLAFAAVWVIWGSTYLAIAVSIESIPPFLMTGARFLAAGGVLYLWARRTGSPRPTAIEWRWAALLGCLFFLVGNGAVAFVEQRVSSGLTALMIALVTAWTSLLEWLRPGGRTPTGGAGFGIVLGFAGTALLVLPSGGVPAVPLVDGLLLFGSTFAWALASVLTRSARLPGNTAMVAATEMLTGGVALLLLAVATGDAARFNPSGVTQASILALLYQIVFGSLVTFTCYSWLLKVSTPSKVSTAGYVNPMVAVFLGWALHGETLTPRSLIASAVIIAGVAAIVTSRSRAGDDLRDPQPAPAATAQQEG